MKSTITIIGGKGFIGKNLTKWFSNLGYQINIIGRNTEGGNTVDEQYVNFYAIDVQNTAEIIETVKNSDYIIWLVHASVPSTRNESLVDDFSVNIMPIIKFLERSEELLHLKKIIYLSSGGTVYGNIPERENVDEEYKQSPISNYGVSKSVIEKYLEYLSKNKNYNCIIIRPSNVYGPYQNLVKPQGIIGYAFKAIRDNNSLDLYDQGKVIRDFIFVDDLAKAIQNCLESELTLNKTEIYNVGSGKGYSIKEILNKIEFITGEKLNLIQKTSRNFDCEYNVLDNEKIYKHNGWKSETNIDTGLSIVWEWIKNDKKQ